MAKIEIGEIYKIKNYYKGFNGLHVLTLDVHNFLYITCWVFNENRFVLLNEHELEPIKSQPPTN